MKQLVSIFCLGMLLHNGGVLGEIYGLLGPNSVDTTNLAVLPSPSPGPPVEPEVQYRLCIPDRHMSLCRKMITDSHSESRLLCVSAPDKVGCIDRIIRGDADWTILDPEELYIAHRYLPRGLLVAGELRSREFSSRDHLYSPVAVIKKSSGIRQICDLRGKRSCHTGFGKTAGWRIPFSHLFTKGELQCSRNASLNVAELDLDTVANYFGPTCAPGKWVTDAKLDQDLKAKYPQLCQLCKNPESCSKSDDYSGYDGALKCLTAENGGDVAWTKWDAVQEFFQLGTATPLDITDQYELLCGDGSRQPLTSPNPCSWAKRPWRSIAVTGRLAGKPEEIRKVQELVTILRRQAQNSTEVPAWLTKVLDFYSNGHVEHLFPPQKVKTLTPETYLKPFNYLESLWHPSCGSHEKHLRICVVTQPALQKCNALKMAAIGHRIAPGFSCVLTYSASSCSKMISNGDADLMIADAAVASKIENLALSSLPNKLVSILRESEPTDVAGQTVPYRYALTLIKNSLSGEFQGSLELLKGKSSCHGSIKSVSGWNAPLSVLRDAGQITGPNCDLAEELSRYFVGSCVPGATQNKEYLCSLCAGDRATSGDAATPETVCADNPTERYFGSSGAIRCLTENVADVAFTDHVALLEALKGPNRDDLANLKLLCRNGTVTTLENFRACHWGLVGSQKVLAREGEQDAVLRENAWLNLLRAQEMFGRGGKQENIFRMFGDFYGTGDVLFQDSSLGLQRELGLEETVAENQLITDFSNCSAGRHPYASRRPACQSGSDVGHFHG